jgi:hypothetical protein
MGKKICISCKIEKSLSEFHVLSTNIDGRNNKCAACVCEYHRNRYLKKHPIPCTKTEAVRRRKRTIANKQLAKFGASVVDFECHPRDDEDAYLINEIVNGR